MCIAPTKGMEGVHSQHKCTFEVTKDTEYNDAGPAAFAVQQPGHHCTVRLQMYIFTKCFVKSSDRIQSWHEPFTLWLGQQWLGQQNRGRRGNIFYFHIYWSIATHPSKYDYGQWASLLVLSHHNSCFEMLVDVVCLLGELCALCKLLWDALVMLKQFKATAVTNYFWLSENEKSTVI